jgi:prevent-host-death family protein
MKTASITEAKNSLSALIDGLKSGSPVLIVDRGRPVARLEPVIIGDQGGTEGWRGSSVTALCGAAARSRHGHSSAASRARVPAHRRSMRSSKSAGKEGEIFGDASAIVPLVAEPAAPRLQTLAGWDLDMLVWWVRKWNASRPWPALSATLRSTAKGRHSHQPDDPDRRRVARDRAE